MNYTTDMIYRTCRIGKYINGSIKDWNPYFVLLVLYSVLIEVLDQVQRMKKEMKEGNE